MEANLMVFNFCCFFFCFNFSFNIVNRTFKITKMICVMLKATVAKYARHTVNANELIQ